MEFEKEKNISTEGLSQMLDRGIDDMERKRELPLDDAFRLIDELVEKRRSERA